MKVLITGGAGFIGSHIAEAFQDKAEVVILDNLRTGKHANLEGLNVTFVNGDIRDRNAVMSCMKGVDYVFHLAAMVSVPESMINPTECVEINNKGLLIVLEEAAKSGVKKLCFSSSSAIYGDSPASPKLETMLPEPKSPYAVSKLDGEYYCKIFTETKKLQTVSFRYFNVFGPRQDTNSAYAAAIPIFTSRALLNESITIYGDGEQTRDFIYVKDVVMANVYFSQNNYTGVYNVGYGKKITINDLVSKMRTMTNSSSKVQYLPERAGDIKHSAASIDKLLSTGFKATSDFDSGLRDTISSFTSK